MYLLVGLGNPGSEYSLNRHNVGFMCIDEIRTSYGFPSEKSKFSGFLSEGQVDHQKILLFKPLTYMNRSGHAVAEAARFYKITPEHIIVFHDDLDLLPGKIRLKRGGGHGGHNGLKDLDTHLGTQYWRLRIGIGRPQHKGGVISYVLSDFSKQERAWLDSLIVALADELHLLLSPRKEEYVSKIMQMLPPPHTSGERNGI
ncbi:MAG: hypothetical protein ACD_16C00237G0001 [uncultured bacterium]|nr:MAG: hypothetical protein ACD_16C00237G0001 [uncultured bacterium]OFW69687.1 MAG: aminoacyl-tRNA hydrolase [Alphaproteobacteria bacterium GWC2_42_16]OFW74263.1 MAG: aminoacyl-tRNA hydrolase [Alphaproteobacteria bacterium GWA2_41_27]OFW84488.1 MAG: aminoacyl-tRNA hydrolase [Alphaproteobacteria bacterium RIFCSPHIGHO2_12_FULL_42_100]OFW86701.1 MAG: aminoacyl-tRNA hydrolase [Alphaproteobacteria bacterium RBG_16_42_14]OFW92334.1 MAG: aminoacyl-tRNA hydrolase [Alphaproteobacteria bacterium RIFCSP